MLTNYRFFILYYFETKLMHSKDWILLIMRHKFSEQIACNLHFDTFQKQFFK